MTENWKLCNSNADFKKLCRKFELNELTVRLLVNRGYNKETDIEKYLFPSFNSLYPAELMKDMSKAVALLTEKIKQRKKIRIIGDYDVDGVTATYILYDIVRKCNADADYRIPDRIREGYGLNISLIKEAAADGIDTILTCDNGISAKNEIKYAKEIGMTVIITDHHEIPDEKPDADAIINPRQKECPYPFKELCGAVIAAKFADKLYEHMTGQKNILKEYIGELALATVCDVMELIDENRTIVKLGMTALSQMEKPGLKRLMELNCLQNKKITTTHMGYVLGPCLNATGRLDTARRGVELLSADTEERADTLSNELIMLNEQRKSMTDHEVKRASEIALGDEYKEDRVLLIYLTDCHESIAGIIAGRIREQFYKPVIIFTDSEDADGDIIKGSGRSIEGYHMFDELSKCSELFEKFGGHALAAGMSIKRDNLVELRKRLNNNCSLTEEQMIPKVLIDGVLMPALLDIDMINEMEMLEPYGKGNRKPLLAAKKLIMKKMSIIGKNANHLKFILSDGTDDITALYFNDGCEMKEELIEHYGNGEVQKALLGRENAIRLTIAYFPSINTYMNSVEIQVIINHYRFE